MAKKHKGHKAKHHSLPPPSPMPGPHEFDAGQEQAMRQGRRPPMPPQGEPDEDDMGGMGGGGMPPGMGGM